MNSQHQIIRLIRVTLSRIVLRNKDLRISFFQKPHSNSFLSSRGRRKKGVRRWLIEILIATFSSKKLCPLRDRSFASFIKLIFKMEIDGIAEKRRGREGWKRDWTKSMIKIWNQFFISFFLYFFFFFFFTAKITRHVCNIFRKYKNPSMRRLRSTLRSYAEDHVAR